MGVVGIGTDLVGVARFGRSLERTPALAARLFTTAEQVTASGAPRKVESLAARFAAKEAVCKAIGAPKGCDWHDCEIVPDDDGRPQLRITGKLAVAADAYGVTRWHLSLTHDADLAAAMVVAEGKR